MMGFLGLPDGEVIDRREMVSAVRRIARVLAVPLSADVVAGFGETPKEVATTVRSVIEAGAIGINIEDFVHETKELYAVEKQVEKLKAIKALGESMRIPLVINARTDALRDRKSTRLNSSHSQISYAVFCLKKTKNKRVFIDNSEDDVSISFTH